MALVPLAKCVSFLVRESAIFYLSSAFTSPYWSHLSTCLLFRHAMVSAGFVLTELVLAVVLLLHTDCCFVLRLMLECFNSICRQRHTIREDGSQSHGPLRAKRSSDEPEGFPVAGPPTAGRSMLHVRTHASTDCHSPRLPPFTLSKKPIPNTI